MSKSHKQIVAETKLAAHKAEKVAKAQEAAVKKADEALKASAVEVVPLTPPVTIEEALEAAEAKMNEEENVAHNEEVHDDSTETDRAALEAEVAAEEARIAELKDEEKPFVTNVPAAPIEDGFERITVSSPFWINGRQYGPGLCDVPVGTFAVYKSVLVRE